MRIKVNGFDWDAGNVAKCQKHGISLAEVESVFVGAPLVGPDITHSAQETRFRAIGRTDSGRVAFVVFTLRSKADGQMIRPISARYMHKKEVQKYERITQG